MQNDKLSLFYLLNRSFQKIAAIDVFASALWVKRYQDVGESEIYLPTAYANDFECGLFLQRADTGATVEIQSIESKTDEENGDYSTIRGKSIETLLSQRIIWDLTLTSGMIEGIIYRLVEQNLTRSDMYIRNMSFRTAALKGLPAEGTYQFDGDNLLEAVKKLCVEADYGFQIVNNTFEVYSGTDRSYSQDVNPYVIFSAKLDNLSQSTYTKNAAGQKNVCKVYCDDSTQPYGFYKKIVGNGSGIGRYETFTKAGSNTPEDEMEEKGQTILNSSIVSEKFECEIIPTYEYGKDYFVGDIVQIENEYGNKAKARVIEVIESNDEAGYKCIPTLKTIE